MKIALVLACVLSISAAEDPSCPDPFLPDNDSGTCFIEYFNFGFPVIMDWNNVQSYCNIIGLQLYDPATVSADFAKRFEHPLALGLYRDAGSPDLKSSPYGKPYSGPTNWGTGEPKAPVKKQKQCAFASGTDGTWFLDSCSLEPSPVCQLPLAAITTTSAPEFFVQVGNAFYAPYPKATTRASAIKICNAVGADIYGFEDLAFLQYYLLEGAGQIGANTKNLIFWTDASPSGNTWKYLKGTTAPVGSSPKARPRTKCLAAVFKPAAVTRSFLKSTCNKKRRFWCRISGIDGFELFLRSLPAENAGLNRDSDEEDEEEVVAWEGTPFNITSPYFKFQKKNN